MCVCVSRARHELKIDTSQQLLASLSLHSRLVKLSIARRLFDMISRCFVQSTKIDTSYRKLRVVVQPCGDPCGVLEGQCVCPYGVFEQGLRDALLFTAGVQFEYAEWLPLRVFEVFVLTSRPLRSLAYYHPL